LFIDRFAQYYDKQPMIAAPIPVKDESWIFHTGNAPSSTEVIPFPIEVVSFPTEDV